MRKQPVPADRADFIADFAERTSNFKAFQLIPLWGLRNRLLSYHCAANPLRCPLLIPLWLSELLRGSLWASLRALHYRREKPNIEHLNIEH